ncbi:unnamed protein product [Strongylus vulgaris]|uniref:Uncharacterized protein n=1 Tax=Strongylus vulgaris TaxID=40348 RepID=A0A3P7KIF7_STRVU|nr:unnamed protein product [Strongylus vulgaris]
MQLRVIAVVMTSIQVTHLTDHLKKPANSFDSEATDCIYRALKVMAKHSQNNTLASLCPSPVSSPVPDKVNDSPENDLAFDELASGDHLERNDLCFSPTRQIGNLEDGSELTQKLEAVVPRLTLEFSPTTSVQHTPLPTSRRDLVPLNTPRIGSNANELSHCCHQCHNQHSYLDASDFLYLFLFGLGTALIFYYLYLPPLHEGPVY